MRATHLICQFGRRTPSSVTGSGWSQRMMVLRPSTTTNVTLSTLNVRSLATSPPPPSVAARQQQQAAAASRSRQHAQTQAPMANRQSGVAPLASSAAASVPPSPSAASSRPAPVRVSPSEIVFEVSPQNIREVISSAVPVIVDCYAE
jgi:hypothetical protein